MRGMKWYMRVLLAVAFALLFVGAGMTAVQAKGGAGDGIAPQWWTCGVYICIPYGPCTWETRWECCYHDGSMTYECYDIVGCCN